MNREQPFRGFTPLPEDYDAPSPARSRGGRRTTSPNELTTTEPAPDVAPPAVAGGIGVCIRAPQVRRVKVRPTSLIAMLFEAVKQWCRGG
jgi:hypothetical protein